MVTLLPMYLKQFPVSYVCKNHFCLLYVEISHLNIFIYFMFRNITFAPYTKKREKKKGDGYCDIDLGIFN